MAAKPSQNDPTAKAAAASSAAVASNHPVLLPARAEQVRDLASCVSVAEVSPMIEVEVVLLIVGPFVLTEPICGLPPW